MPASGRASPSRKIERNRMLNWSKSMSCSCATAVEEDRAEDHLDQQRIVDRCSPTTLRAERLAAGLAELVVIVQRGHQAAKVVDLAGKLPPHFGLRSNSKSLENRSVAPGNMMAEPSCGARAHSSQAMRSCRSSRASGPVRVPLGAKLVMACSPTSKVRPRCR